LCHSSATEWSTHASRWGLVKGAAKGIEAFAYRAQSIHKINKQAWLMQQQLSIPALPPMNLLATLNTKHNTVLCHAVLFCRYDYASSSC
jgi:hypothetical protein